jgi:hypothetical protein
MTDTVTIYMPLLNEGTDVWRPVSAVARPDGTYLVLGPIPVDQEGMEDEEWMFAPGTIVLCQPKQLSDGLRSVAIAISD